MRTDPRTLLGVALGVGAYYWASKQPGGVKGTWDRMQQGFRDIQSGQDPMQVGKRFMRGGSEEPAGLYMDEAPTANTAAANPFQEPYRDYVTEI